MSAGAKHSIADMLGSIIGAVLALLIIGSCVVSCEHKEQAPYNQSGGDDPHSSPNGTGNSGTN